MTSFRELVNKIDELNKAESTEKQKLTEGTADTVRYITKTKELFTEMEDSEKAEDQQLDEKWGTEMHTKEKDKGMFKGKTKAELKSQLSHLKDKQESHKEKHGKADEKTSKKIKQVEFALRAKNKFGKVKESLESYGDKDAVKELETLEAEFITECVDFDAE